MIDFSEQIERIGDSLACFLESTDPSVLNWKFEAPNGAVSRTALELASECIAVNLYFASLLRGENPVVPAGGPVGPVLMEAADASAQLVSSSQEFAAAVRGLSEEGYTKSYTHWRRGSIVGKNLVVGGYRNMAYHAGQVNLIQILNGDADFHSPPTW